MDKIRTFLKENNIKIPKYMELPYEMFETLNPNTEVVLLKSRQIGATELAKNISLYIACDENNKDIHTLYIAPRESQIRRFGADRILTTINRSPKIKDAIDPTELISASYLGFKNYNALYAISASNRDSLHGLSVDLIIADEIQDFSKNVIENLNYSTSASKWKTHIYIASPTLTDGNNIGRDLWKTTDMREYYYRCVECKKYFRPTLKLMVKQKEIACKFCGHNQMKFDACFDGKWTPKRKSKNINRIGFHLSSLIDPNIEKERFDQLQNESSPLRFHMEILGKLPTKKMIREHATLDRTTNTELDKNANKLGAENEAR